MILCEKKKWSDTHRQKLYRLNNPQQVKRDNEARKLRLDRRKFNRWKKLQHWIYARCTYEKCNNYHDVGAKGIKCLITWQEIMRLWFRDIAWMMKEPEIDRVDPDGHYEATNCRFIERKENLARRRKRTGSVERDPGEEG